MRKFILGLALVASLAIVGVAWATTGTYDNTGNATAPVKDPNDNGRLWSDAYCQQVDLIDFIEAQGLSNHYVNWVFDAGHCPSWGGTGGNPGPFHVKDVRYIIFLGSDVMGLHKVTPDTCAQTSAAAFNAPGSGGCTQRSITQTFTCDGGNTGDCGDPGYEKGSDNIRNSCATLGRGTYQPYVAVEYGYDIINTSTNQVYFTGEVFGGPTQLIRLANYVGGGWGQDATTAVTCP